MDGQTDTKMEWMDRLTQKWMYRWTLGWLTLWAQQAIARGPTLRGALRFLNKLSFFYDKRGRKIRQK